MVKDTRQGWALLAAMFAVFLPLLWLCVSREQAANPTLASLPIDQVASALQAGGNMEGKEVRFGISSSALYATATTAASNGGVNAMHDSFSPMGGFVPLWLIQLGEIIFGGVGSGMYGMLMFAIVAVFVAGLMVGRTPEYLGKKIEAHEMKMASLGILFPCASVLIFTAIAVVTEAGRKGPLNPGPHGFSEILYAFSSASNNNGSAFGGLTGNTPFYNTTLGMAMFFGRFWVKIAALALAGVAGEEEDRPQQRRHPADAHAALRGHARRRHRHRRRADLHPLARARAHRRAALTRARETRKNTMNTNTKNLVAKSAAAGAPLPDAALLSAEAQATLPAPVIPMAPNLARLPDRSPGASRARAARRDPSSIPPSCAAPSSIRFASSTRDTRCETRSCSSSRSAAS